MTGSNENKCLLINKGNSCSGLCVQLIVRIHLTLVDFISKRAYLSPLEPPAETETVSLPRPQPRLINSPFITRMHHDNWHWLTLSSWQCVMTWVEASTWHALYIIIVIIIITLLIPFITVTSFSSRLDFTERTISK